MTMTDASAIRILERLGFTVISDPALYVGYLVGKNGHFIKVGVPVISPTLEALAAGEALNGMATSEEAANAFKRGVELME